MDHRPRVTDRSGVLCKEEHPNIWHATFLTRGTRPTWARLPTNVHTPPVEEKVVAGGRGFESRNPP